METIKKKPVEDKLKTPVGITIFIGIILKLMNNPYGSIVFTVGFLAYFILKIVKLSRIQRFFWTRLHTVQLILIIACASALILMYYDYPYSRIAFILLIFLESLVNIKIIINKYVGNENFKSIISFIGRLIRR